MSESEASYNFDLEVYKHLVDSAPDEREKQRLLRVARACALSTLVRRMARRVSIVSMMSASKAPITRFVQWFLRL